LTKGHQNIRRTISGEGRVSQFNGLGTPPAVSHPPRLLALVPLIGLRDLS